MRRVTGVAIMAVGVYLGVAGGAANQVMAQTSQPVVRAAEAQDLLLDLGDGVSMKLVQVPAGKFLMGSPATEKGRKPDETQHEVTISNPFYMGKYAVTVEQYAQFTKDTGERLEDPGFQQTGDHPAVRVDWNNAQAFCKWLSKKTGKTVVLPTEAQREYASRAGSKTRFSFGNSDNDLAKHANYCDKSNTTQLSRPNYRDMARSDGFDNSAPVGSFKPNAWGLYDMHGNVWEWCSDYYADSYPRAAATDPSGPATGTDRVLRGGSWLASVGDGGCRSATRVKSRPDWRYSAVGLRVVVLPADND